jgi:hypothetical protein
MTCRRSFLKTTALAALGPDRSSARPLGGGRVGRRDLVGYFRVVRKRLEAVREARGHVEHRASLGCQFEPLPAAECRRVGAQIEDDVVKGSAHDAHNLDLAMRRALEMQPADRAAPNAARMVDLHEARLESDRRKFLGTEDPGEEARASPRLSSSINRASASVVSLNRIRRVSLSSACAPPVLERHERQRHAYR